MTLVYQNHWICDPAGAASLSERATGAAGVHWLLHGAGCVRVARKQDTLLIQFDGRLFDQARCEQLLAHVDRLAGMVDRYQFSVWSGVVEPGTWARYTATSAKDARRYIELVHAIATATDAATTITASVLRFERLLMERRGVFDEVVAAWLLDRRPGGGTIGRLFAAGRERSNEGLKIVRRFGRNLTFESYRLATDHSWTENQAARMLGNDLLTVPDRRLAQTLRVSADRVAASGEPVLERIRGAIRADWGVSLTEYYRLSLPLAVDAEGRPDTLLIATHW